MPGWARLCGKGRQAVTVRFLRWTMPLYMAMHIVPTVAVAPAAAASRAVPEAVVVGQPHAVPAGIPWAITRFQYSTGGASVADVLADLSAATRVPITAGDVDGADAADGEGGSRPSSVENERVEGRFDLPPQRFLDVLAHSYDLDWFYDGSVLHVDPVSARRTLLLRLNYVPRAALHELLAHGDMTSGRFPLVDGESAGVVAVTGPPAYVSLVARAAQRLDSSARAQVRTVVRMIALRNATAANRMSYENGRRSVTEGVAARARRQLAPPDAAAAGLVEYETPLPVITADARTNSVLIRDSAERLSTDARAVTALDVRAGPIAVDALVVDVDTAAVPALALGVLTPDLNAAAGSAHVRVGDAGAALRARIDVLRAQRRAHVTVDQTLLSIDGATADLEQRAGLQLDAASEAGSTAGEHSDTTPADGFALRVLPSVARSDVGNRARSVALAAEWRSRVGIQVVRAVLTPRQGIVMVGPSVEVGDGRTRLVMLVPHILDDR
jgi:type III secretion protein C